MKWIKPKDIGKKGEKYAVRFLRKKGYQIKERNYRFGKCEIDIIAQDGNTIVFVEVKSRTSDEYGTPQEAVDKRKQQQITKVAFNYIQSLSNTQLNGRFDVIAVLFNRKSRSPQIEHLENAFQIGY